MLEPLPTVKEQIREQTGGGAAAFFKRLPLWVIVFGGATLTWWQVARLCAVADGLLSGQGWEIGTLGMPLLLATLGVVIAVGFSAITVMATDQFSAVLCAALLFAPTALFHLWEPLWIWWVLGPLAVLIVINFIVIRSDIARQVSWRPMRIIVGSTLWVMILIGVAAPALTAMLLGQRQDNLRPEDFRPLARRIIARVPAEYIHYLIEELPTHQLGAAPVTAPPPPGVSVPMSRPKLPKQPPMPSGTGPQPITNAPQWGQPGPAQAQAASPPLQWGQTMPPLAPPTVTPPVPAFNPPAVTPPQPVMTSVLASPPAPPTTSTQERPRTAVDERLVEELAVGLWNALSTQGAGYAVFPPLLGFVASLALSLIMIPLLLVAVVASFVLVGFSLALLRAMGYVNLVTVRVEVPRFTLRGLQFAEEGEPPVQ